MQYRLIKTEPYKYSWEKFVKEKKTFWDGVRNYQARNNLQAMKKWDICLWYHSNEWKEIIGTAKVVKEAYQDPTTDDDRWVAVDLVPEKQLNKPVTLEQIKQEKNLQEMTLLKQQRLSVAPVTKEEYNRIISLGMS